MVVLLLVVDVTRSSLFKVKEAIKVFFNGRAIKALPPPLSSLMPVGTLFKFKKCYLSFFFL